MNEIKKNQFRKKKKKHQQGRVSPPNPRLCKQDNLIQGKAWKIMKLGSQPNPILKDKIKKIFNFKKLKKSQVNPG